MAQLPVLVGAGSNLKSDFGFDYVVGAVAGDDGGVDTAEEEEICVVVAVVAFLQVLLEDFEEDFGYVNGYDLWEAFEVH